MTLHYFTLVRANYAALPVQEPLEETSLPVMMLTDQPLTASLYPPETSSQFKTVYRLDFIIVQLVKTCYSRVLHLNKYVIVKRNMGTLVSYKLIFFSPFLVC